jgi:pimeloyl-ACP methyl ester carboxylesterase
MKKITRITLIGISSLLLLIALPLLGAITFILLKCPKQSIDISMQEHTADIDGLTVYYRTAGDPSNQPVVFLHGWGARKDGRCGIDGVIEALVEQGFYVAAPEHPGLIRSDAPRGLWSYGEYAGALHALLEPLQLKKPIIMGQSFGGGIATEYAAKYGNDIRALVLIDAVTSKRSVAFAQRMKHRWDNLAHELLQSSFTPLFLKKRIIRLYLGVPYEMINEKRIGGGAKMMLIGKYKDLERPLDVDYQDFDFPLILLWGDKDTWNTPIQRAKEIHEEVEESKLIIVPGTHTVLFQRPKEIVGLIVSSLPQPEP